MEHRKRILTDVLTFVLIALAGALFGFAGTGGIIALTGRVVCCISSVLAALAMVVKRPPESLL
jgi:uncharacterized membrane protein YtjA (UPF0391 family)